MNEVWWVIWLVSKGSGYSIGVQSGIDLVAKLEMVRGGYVSTFQVWDFV